MENVEVFIRNALGAVKWIVLNKCKCDAEDRDKVLRVVDRALKNWMGLTSLTSTRYGIRRRMLCRQAYMAAIMQTCCVCISLSLPLILALLMKSTALSLRSILKRIRMTGGAELGIC